MDLLKKFATFLKTDHLEELAKVNHAILLPMHLPIMKYFEHLPPEQLLQLTIKGLDEFLTDIENDRAVEKQRSNLEKWERNELEDYPDLKLEPSDFILGNGAQHLAMLKFIPLFAKNVEEAVHITTKLSEYYMQSQDIAFQIMGRIQKKAETALAESEERFRAISQSAGDAIIVYGLDMRIDFWNASAEKMFGYKAGEAAGKSVMLIYPPEKKDEYETRIKGFAEAKEQRLKEKYWEGKTWELECINNAGTRFPVELSASYFETSKGSFFAIIVHDITERKEAATSLEKQALRLAASNEELEQFAYVASHDLKEPLRMISNYVQLLEKRYKDKFDEERRQYVGYAVEGTLRMRNLINDLLEYSRVNRVEHSLEKVDLNQVMKDVISNLHELIAEKQANVKTDQLPTITGDRIQMEQLFQNLVGNGIKFKVSEKNPAVMIKCEQLADSWQFSIQDNGIGIDPQFKNKIFKMFQRLHPREEYPGNGIGLAICKKIIERHKGQIWFDSKPGDGATFHFR